MRTGGGRRRYASGLTLLEMMVVLMIAGMALALGYQSLAQWRRAEASISGLGGDLRQERLAQQWFESSLRGLLPVEAVAFSGDAGHLSGITTRPVLASQGGASVVEWRIDPQAPALLLEEDGKSLRLPLATGTTRFAYLDQEGKEHDQWPPKLGLHPHLPAAIALVQQPADGQRSRYWLAAIAGKPDPAENLMYEPETE